MAYAAGMQVYVLNARDVYFYAKALSGRAKTDRLDAAVIATYAAEHHARLHPWRPAVGVEQQLHELLRFITAARVAASELGDAASLQTACRQLDDSFECFFEQLDAQLQVLVASDAELDRNIARLRTITGFGPQASVAGGHCSSDDFANADALVAYCGLDPRPCDRASIAASAACPSAGPRGCAADVPGGVCGQSQQGAQAAV